jgi:hypothetical protein
MGYYRTNPDAIFTNNSLVVTGNWSGTYGNTGASASGVNSYNVVQSYSKSPNICRNA